MASEYSGLGECLLLTNDNTGDVLCASRVLCSRCTTCYVGMVSSDSALKRLGTPAVCHRPCRPINDTTHPITAEGPYEVVDADTIGELRLPFMRLFTRHH